MQNPDFGEIVALICKEDPRFDRKAYDFVRLGLDHTVKELRKKDATRAYCTVEAAVLDTRSGVIIYTTRASENFAAEQSSNDMNFAETVGRAEQQAVGRAMVGIAREIAAFLEGGA